MCDTSTNTHNQDLMPDAGAMDTAGKWGSKSEAVDFGSVTIEGHRREGHGVSAAQLPS